MSDKHTTHNEVEEEKQAPQLSRNEYLRKWRAEHPDYQRKWWESQNLSQKVACSFCGIHFSKNYMYKHKKKHDTTQVTP